MSDAEQEPSMEEILASIRRIISDDNEQGETNEMQPAVQEVVAEEEVVAVDEPLRFEESPAPTPEVDDDDEEDEEEE